MASSNLQVYKCSNCGAEVEVIRGGSGTLVCCDQPMVLMAENTTDAAKEKHVPVVARIEGGYQVAVGSTPHPMTKEHYITWIELIADGKAYRQSLSPGEKPQASFYVEAKEVTARAYCNLHGLWKGQ